MEHAFVGNPYFFVIYVYIEEKNLRAHTSIQLECVKIPANTGRVWLHVWLPCDDICFAVVLHYFVKKDHLLLNKKISFLEKHGTNGDHILRI